VLPSESKKLHSKLSEIEQALHNQETTVRDASKAADVKEGEIAGIIAGIAPAIRHANKDVPTYEKAQRKKEYSLNKLELALQRRTVCAAWFTAIATLLAFGAAGIYAHIASEQLDQMITANHATRCATLVTAQSAAESAYHSREQERAWVEPWIPNANSFTVSNPGKTVGREVRVFVRTTVGESQFGPLTISPYTYFPAPFIFPVSIPPHQRLRGKITYVDVFGVSHWVKFCYSFGEKGQMSPCETGNEEDHNLENPPENTIPRECRQ
jgi:hypothetical protein